MLTLFISHEICSCIVNTFFIAQTKFYLVYPNTSPYWFVKLCSELHRHEGESIRITDGLKVFVQGVNVECHTDSVFVNWICHQSINSRRLRLLSACSNFICTFYRVWRHPYVFTCVIMFLPLNTDRLLYHYSMKTYDQFLWSISNTLPP